MECGLGQVLGFTSEAIAFVIGLEKLIDTRVEGWIVVIVVTVVVDDVCKSNTFENHSECEQ
jgi:hypothetical protein